MRHLGKALIYGAHHVSAINLAIAAGLVFLAEIIPSLAMVVALYAVAALLVVRELVEGYVSGVAYVRAARLAEKREAEDFRLWLEELKGQHDAETDALAAAERTNTDAPFNLEDLAKFRDQLDSMPSAEEPERGEGEGGALVGAKS